MERDRISINLVDKEKKCAEMILTIEKLNAEVVGVRK
jgi:hypothetical protein